MKKQPANSYIYLAKAMLFLILFLLNSGLTLIAQTTTKNKIFLFKNGNWFDGKKFIAKTFYSNNGIFYPGIPSHKDSIIDLQGKFVVPPFGEAHNHNVATSPKIDSVIKRYLDDGVFYVKNPNSLTRTKMELAGKINIPLGIDVSFANGGLTSSGGHPIWIAERQIAYGVWTESDGEGGFYYTIKNKNDLHKKWSNIIKNKPDFIKTYLLYSEEHDKRKNDNKYKDWRGLDPMLLPEIVQLAHQSDLRVSAHVETAADFHNALIAGVDEINHLPGFRPEMNDPANYQNLSRFMITEQDAELAGKRQVVVVTTVGDLLEILNLIINARGPQAEFAKTVLNMITENLQLLKKHKVKIAIGSDSYSKTSVYEALKLYDLEIFNNLELLKMWCEITPSTIFPKRKIGHLKKGYEASFLLLNNDPLKDFKSTEQILLRVKQGVILDN
jgi:hypothetical protein